ncbi:6097_t:CDS:1, partial [Entrophospora sp. SA101]
WFDNSFENSNSIFELLTENMKSYARSKRPLSYLGNSEKKKIGMLDAEKNGNTLDRFFSTEKKNIQMNENDMNSHNDYLIEESNAIENNLMEDQEYEDEIEKIDKLLNDPSTASNGYKIKLKTYKIISNY